MVKYKRPCMLSNVYGYIFLRMMTAWYEKHTCVTYMKYIYMSTHFDTFVLCLFSLNITFQHKLRITFLWFDDISIRGKRRTNWTMIISPNSVLADFVNDIAIWDPFFQIERTYIFINNKEEQVERDFLLCFICMHCKFLKLLIIYIILSANY